ncbi:MAG: hypothetical protein ED559_01780 [Phycisphaera sp.]|nr:MAG: hypothetical protein ED559_01780 [Phycisphaera sp.]
MILRTLHAVSLAALIAATGAHAQPEDDPLPTLDELLGLNNEDDTADEESAERTDATDAELDRQLDTDKPIADEFLEAVGLMRESATRLSGQTDTGVVTQRLQEDILRRLDELIDKAGEQSSSSSSSSSEQEQQQRQQPNQQSRDENQSNINENQDTTNPPGGQDARLGAQATLDGARWGNLPARLRDALLQGSSDSYSSLYKSMTETYYRRLAEEASE